MMFGTTGKGRSVFPIEAKKNARAKGHMFVDATTYPLASGLFPAEYEYARRLALSLSGKLPRGLLSGRIKVLSTPKYVVKKRRGREQYITTTNGILLYRKLIGEAQRSLETQTGIWLNQPQIISLMEKFNIDETLAEYDEAETQIRGLLSEALAVSLLGRSWPTYGESANSGPEASVSFESQINDAAKAAGYRVSF